MTIDNVKSVEFILTLSGRGVVQTDHKDQKWIYNKVKDGSRASNDNNTFAKANYYKNEQDEVSRKIKISSDGLRHAIHISGHETHVQNVDTDKHWIPFISSVDTFLRGYMKPNGEKKKSVYCIPDAEIVNGAIPTLEVHSKSGERDSNSLFFREHVGDTVYSSRGFINIRDLQFVSMCDVFGRRNVQDDDAEKYIELLENNIGSTIPKVGYHILKHSAYHIPERGIVLTDENCKFLISELLKKMSNIMINKSCGGFAKTQKLEIKLHSSYDSDSETVTVFEQGKQKFDVSFLSNVSFYNAFEESDYNVYSDCKESINGNISEKAEAKETKERAKEERKNKKLK